MSAGVKASASAVPVSSVASGATEQTLKEPEWPSWTSPPQGGQRLNRHGPGLQGSQLWCAAAGASPGDSRGSQRAARLAMVGPVVPRPARLICRGRSLRCVALPKVGFAAQNHSQVGNPAFAAPCLARQPLLWRRGLPAAQKSLKRVLIRHFIWIRGCVSFDWLKVTCWTVIAARDYRGSQVNKAGCLLSKKSDFSSRLQLMQWKLNLAMNSGIYCFGKNNVNLWSINEIQVLAKSAGMKYKGNLHRQILSTAAAEKVQAFLEALILQVPKSCNSAETQGTPYGNAVR